MERGCEVTRAREKLDEKGRERRRKIEEDSEMKRERERKEPNSAFNSHPCPPFSLFLLRRAENNANFGITLRRAGINMKGEVSISNWYLGDPKQSQVRAKVDELLRAYPRNFPSLFCPRSRV